MLAVGGGRPAAVEPGPSFLYLWPDDGLVRCILRAAGQTSYLHTLPFCLQARRLIRPLRLAPQPPLRRGDSVELVCLSK